MLLLRLLGLLLIIAVGICAGLGLLTRQAYFFRWAWSLLRYGAVVALVFVLVFVVERLIAPVI